MFNYWYLSSAINAAKDLPKEFIYAGIAGLTINELHRRHSNVKLEEIKANAKARELELEVEKLRLQIALRETRND
jgi:hypothetical protein